MGTSAVWLASPLPRPRQKIEDEWLRFQRKMGVDYGGGGGGGGGGTATTTTTTTTSIPITSPTSSSSVLSNAPVIVHNFSIVNGQNEVVGYVSNFTEQVLLLIKKVIQIPFFLLFVSSSTCFIFEGYSRAH